MIKKLLMNENGEISLSKLGALIVSVSGIVLAIPTLELQVVVVPAIIMDIAKIMSFVGGGTAAIGFRDALKK